ncbi:hypothetical protein JP75_07645 [Devosia riboflavina]|uniref:Helix-turn-helix domain-containing protein n=2 Tax=Devosia riboflavina TaxID=46914 RepID=A0A087M3H0_9HYPH|nr:hypothetical protein JP75_07645 [Devosia riboflavina]
MEPKTALEKAIEAAGSQRALAAILKVSQQVVSYRVQSGKGLSAEDALKVEASTGMSRHELRPDIFGPPPEPALQATG